MISDSQMMALGARREAEKDAEINRLTEEIERLKAGNVPCSECRYGQKEKNGVYCERLEYIFSDDWYCKDGERK